MATKRHEGQDDDPGCDFRARGAKVVAVVSPLADLVSSSG
jgi:hypothetical protein